MSKGELLKTTTSQAYEVQELVIKECANLVDGKYCLLMDGLFCPVLTTISYVACNYCIEIVLPRKPQLKASIKAGTPNEEALYKNCTGCMKSFIAKSKRECLCSACKKERKRDSNKKNYSRIKQK